MTHWRNFRDKDEFEFNAWAWLVLLNTGARSVVFMYSDVKAGFKGLWWQFQAHKAVIQCVIHHWGIIFKKQHSSTVALTYWLLRGAFIHASELWGENQPPRHRETVGNPSKQQISVGRKQYCQVQEDVCLKLTDRRGCSWFAQVRLRSQPWQQLSHFRVY